MSFDKNKPGKAAVFLAVIVGFAVILSACGSPLGFGRQIDWEPPVLTLEKVPTPIYVGDNGYKLRGTVKDNVAVARVVLTNTVTGEELFFAAIDGNRWEIELKFDKSQNGEKIIGQISAYDTSGNSDAGSTAFVTLIIDIRPPIVENIAIQRTDTRPSRLEPYGDLKELETLDPRGEKKDSLYRYQNGWFYISSVLNDEETRIEDVRLKIFDYEEIDTCLVDLPIDSGYSIYYPRWTVKEEDIIDAGADKWGQAYKTKYYENEARYYYRVVVWAVDKSDNKTAIVEEDEGYICMWAVSDEPKGILDPAIQLTVLQDLENPEIKSTITRGTPLPIDFYDDDSLKWAYAGLFTQDQWNGINPVYQGNLKIQGADDQAKIDWIKQRLTGTGPDSLVLGGGLPLYNWQYDKYGSGSPNEKDMLIEELMAGKSVDEKLVYIATGNKEDDYGDYVLFTMASDSKLSPHPQPQSADWARTKKDIWSYKVWRVKVVDENAPLIVFDTVNGCPEENTFPSPLAGGTSFTIKGYTLRENETGKNGVTIFRMAWIPYGMSGGADSHISAIQKALSDINYGTPYSRFNDSALAGVQHWEFQLTGGTGSGYASGQFDPGAEEFTDAIGSKDIIPPPPQEGGIAYRHQEFSKTFTVMSNDDDIKSGYKNFTYKGELENETKIFVFYAQDNMGHDVFRQLRLLGMKTPPNLTVLDLTHKLSYDDMPQVGGQKLPDPNADGYPDQATGGFTLAYYNALNAYNTNTAVYNILKTKSGEGDASIPFQMYSRETVVKYWVTASKGGDIAINNITMTDITLQKTWSVGSGYNAEDAALSFCEYYPDIANRTFLFEAEDMLGNKASLQRTIAVTNAARLENITTTSQSGAYGIGQTITLKANFSSQVYVVGGIPRLNVRYTRNGAYEYDSIICKNVPTKDNPSLSLEFDFTVKEGFSGVLETMYENIPNYSAPVWIVAGGKEPITLPGPPTGAETTIMDYIRENSPAFLPGYKSELVTMPNWATADNTLQGTVAQPKKTIFLDGTRPGISSVSVDANGKAPYTGSQFYVKTGETVNFTLITGTAGKQIRASEIIPRLQYQIRANAGLMPSNTTYYNTAFTYTRPNGSGLLFSLPVNATSCPEDGELVNVSLYTGPGAGAIVDQVDNAIAANTVTNLVPAGTRIFIKKTPPAAPNATIGGYIIGSTSNTIPFNTTPALVIPASGSVWNGSPAPAPNGSWEETIQYSTNGGLSWLSYTPGVAITGNGTYNLQVRYVDRAGNEGVVRSQSIQVNNSFPRLVSVNTAEPNGWYTSGALTFNLNFADAVRVNAASDATITLTNRAQDSNNIHNSGGTNPSYEIKLQAGSGQTDINRTGSNTITFNWTGIGSSGKEMRDGLYISAVNLSGIRDRFNNAGPSGVTSAPWNGDITIGSDTCANLPWADADACIKVDAIAPRVETYSPGNAGISSDNRTITINFNEPVMIGAGMITVNPYGDYKIPAVLENDGYYFEGTYIAGFYDIYNNSALSAADRNTLTLGANTANPSMSNLALDARTGQSAGPYIKTTNGLKEGAGYTGNYLGSSADGPNPAGTTYLIPDTSTKWVLDYRYSIDNANNIQYANTSNVLTAPGSGVVPAIRAVLTKAKWRWQEMDLVSSVVISDSTVTIALNEPLLDGLQWNLSFPEGAFTDKAGNKVAASTPYWFWSNGVQPPVIRVNRKSFDARTANWESATGRSYSVPGNLNGPGGWGISDFNTVHYRIESETPGAELWYAVDEGTTANGGSVTAAWDNTAIGTSGRVWNNPGVTDTRGEWVLRNLIRRKGLASYTVTENGFSVTRSITADYQGYRSYNRDIPKATLDGKTLTAFPSFQNSFTYSALQASKNYVVAEARITNSGRSYASTKSYEGVFRTVIALNQDSFGGYLGGADRDTNPIMVQGSNIKNGMPSIAGFPLYDAEESGDNRFVKLFYYVSYTPGSNAGGQLYWVSTEIVSQWYNLNSGQCAADNTNTGGTHQNQGDANNYLISGYGDLTYSYNQR